MKKLILTFCTVFYLATQVFSCDPFPWQSYCELNTYTEKFFSGRIAETFENGVSIDLLEVIKGSETRATITIWDGEPGDCNGQPITAYTSDYGVVGDTLVFALSEYPIQTVQFEWDVVGDYRKPDNTFGFYDFKKVNNKQVTVEGENYEYVDYTYNDFLAFLYSGDCIENVNERGGCEGVDDPLSLPWLIELTENINEDCIVKDVVQFDFEGITLFKTDVLNCPYVYDKYYNCTGNLFCIDRVYPDTLECNRDITTAAKNGTLLWEYACTDTIEYEITTPPFCVSDELFTVGITLNTTTRYLLGENHLGNEVFNHRDSESFIGFRIGEGPFIINPKNDFTGCTTQDIIIEEPNCENQGSSCEIEDPIDELPWVKNLIGELSNYCGLTGDPNNIWSGYSLHYSCVEGSGIYEFQPPSCCDFLGYIYDASGSLLCQYGGLAGFSCPEFGSAYGVGPYFEEAEQLWSCYKICSLPKDPGPCEAYVPRYYYDEDTGDCIEFIYGGCEGNANNFETYERCIQGCGYESRCAEVNNPLNKLWINNLIYNADGCAVGSLEQFEHNNEVYFQTVPYAVFPNNDCPADLPTIVYDCLGNVVCTIGGYGNQLSKVKQQEECDAALTNASINNTTLLYNWGCENPLQLQIVQDAIQDECIETIYAFEFENESYVYFDQVCPEFPDGDRYDELYNCNTGETCGRFLFGGYTTCAVLYDKIKDLVTEENIIWPKSNCEEFFQFPTDPQNGCIQAVYSFSYQSQPYLFTDQLCGAIGGSHVLYNCNTDETCYIGGHSGSPNCDSLYVEIYDLLNEESLVWSPPCNYEVSGTVVSENDGFKIELINGEYVTPGDTDFTFYDGQQVELSYIQSPTENFPIVNNVKVICIREVETNIVLFENYNWLNNLVDVTNCTGGTNVTAYDYPGGNFKFIHITKPNGKRDLYFQDGTLYCSDGPGYSCLDGYNLTQSIESWTCNNPIMPPNENELLEKYSWLNINTDNCSALDKITEYDLGSYSFVFVEDNEGSKLYFEDGTFYCANGLDYDCVELYGLNNPARSWACENATQTCIIEDPFSLDWFQALIEDAENDLCGIKEISVFQSQGSTYFSAETGPIYPYCETDSYGILIYDCVGNQICSFNFWYPEIGESCIFEPFGPSGDVIWNYYQDDIFNTYPWLSTLVDSYNCNNSSVQVYTYGSFEFISIENDEGKNLYFQDGTFYCNDGPNYSCVDLYELNAIKSEWNCGGIVQRQAYPVSQKKIDFDVDFKVFPNPNNGQFNIKFGNIDTNGSIHIIDIKGQLIKTMAVEAEQKQVKVSLTDVPKGVYLLQLQNDQKLTTKQIIIQ